MAVAPIPADRRTDITKLIGAFRDYENAHKIRLLSSKNVDKVWPIITSLVDDNGDYTPLEHEAKTCSPE
jgi:hypothetical protein